MTTIPNLASLGVVLRKGTYFPKFCRVELLPVPKNNKISGIENSVKSMVENESRNKRVVTAITLGRSGSDLPPWQQSDTVKVCVESNGVRYSGEYPHSLFKLVDKPKLTTLCTHPVEIIREAARFSVLKKRLKSERLSCVFTGSNNRYCKVPNNSRVVILKVNYSEVEIQLLSGDGRASVSPNLLKWDTVEKLDLNTALTATESVRNTSTSPVLVPINRLVEVGKDNLKRATYMTEAVERKWKRISKTKNHMKHLRKHSPDYELVERVLIESVENSEIPEAIRKVNDAMKELTEALSKYPTRVALRIHEEIEKTSQKQE